MTDVVIEQQLRELADRAEPSVAAAPDLATRVLRRTQARRRSLRGVVGGLGVVGVAAVAIAARSSHAGPYREIDEPSASMTPTVQIGESLLVDSRLQPHRGDVVVAHVTNEGISFDTIKRVVAVGGDTVGCPAQRHGLCTRLVVNGDAVSESYLPHFAVAPFGPTTVTRGSVFLLGDNREASADSRQWGVIPVAAVTGVGVRVLGRDGVMRVIPGAPRHPAPGNGASIDPEQPPPSAQATTP